MRAASLSLILVALACGCASRTGVGQRRPSAPHHRREAPAGLVPGAAGCRAIALEPGVSVDGFLSDRYTWSDAVCAPRSAALVRNEAADPGGTHGGYLREFTYEVDGRRRVARGPTGKWNGFGYTVNHAGLTANSRRVTGAHRVVLAGRHHAIHEFTFRVSPDGRPVDVTVHWLFATGRSNPVFAVTYDAAPAGPGAVRADARAPYGNLAFDGLDDERSELGGLGWGDRYRFTTVGPGPVTLAAAWDYTQPNLVPYVREWASGADAEMGLVQTQTFDQHPAGGDYWGGRVSDCWGRSSEEPGSCPVGDQGAGNFRMPAPSMWPFQLSQYELPYTTTSKRLAWGQTYGAVGQGSFTAFGRALSGYPFQSYSVFVVLGKHTAQPVEAQIAEVEAVQGASLLAPGAVPAGPAGVGRKDEVPYVPAGWDHVYAVWVARADARGAAMRLDTGGATLSDPVFRILGWTSGAPPSRVVLAGKPLALDADAFATVDASTGTLWLTLHGAVTGAFDLAVAP